MVTIKSKQEIEKMREACKIAALAQKAVEEAIKPGISTWELDKIAENVIRENGRGSSRKRISKWSERSTCISRFNMCISK